MSPAFGAVAAAAVVFGLAFGAPAQTRITTDHNTGAAINAEWKFKSVPSPSKNDAAAKARVLMVDGPVDANSAGVEALTDGFFPTRMINHAGISSSRPGAAGHAC